MKSNTVDFVNPEQAAALPRANLPNPGVTTVKEPELLGLIRPLDIHIVHEKHKEEFDILGEETRVCESKCKKCMLRGCSFK